MPTTSAPSPVLPAPGRSAAAPPDRGVLLAVLAVTVVSLAGSFLALATGLNASWWDAVGPTGRLSVPLPMNAALLLLALVAASARRRAAAVAAGVVALACVVAVVSGFFDGGYAADLAPVARVAQVALVLGLATVAVAALRRLVRLRQG
ncbi:hypothetical protein [Oryzobacter telluris]|uniref:hypothetical protein n=1 Tax=Oryzobacter telluris TaxID=3149179 RepID=UPI00370D469C